MFGSSFSKLDSELLRNWNRIVSPVHSLALKCDPLYNKLLDHYTKKYGICFEYLGNDIINNCHEDLKMIYTSVEHEQTVMEDFMSFSVRPIAVLESLKHWHPRLFWGQVSSNYPHLSPILRDIFSSPASIAGVERNHKVKKIVMPSLRCRLKDEKVENRSPCATNLNQ